MLRKLYFTLKPVMPRRLQIALRRSWIRQRRKRFGHVWPIDSNAAKPPDGWSGWPGGKQFAFLVTHDVDTDRGYRKCLRLGEINRRHGFKASFNIVAEQYELSGAVIDQLKAAGFEIGLHGLRHDVNLFESRERFLVSRDRVCRCLKEWGCAGFRHPSMFHNLDWVGELDIEYDASTFDTDPFEPQCDGVGTIFPFWVAGNGKGYVELPYTLPQDFTLFVLMQEESIDIWKRKLDWVAGQGGMAMIVAHPDYMSFDGEPLTQESYPVRYYEEILGYIRDKYQGLYWNPLPRELAAFWREHYGQAKQTK